MYNVIDVCRYIIKYSNDKNYGISNLKLQKILYFVQAYFLIATKDSKPCFREKIEAWDFGPVVPVAYQKYAQFGSCDILTENFEILIISDDYWTTVDIDYNIIKKKDKKMINEVIDKFCNYTATDLTLITMDQNPWQEAHIPNGREEITIDSIRKYFNLKSNERKE